MKSTKKVLLVIAVLLSGTSYAQSIINLNGDTLGHVSNLGVITNDSNQVVGEITLSGIVKNSQGQQIGSVDGSNFKNTSGTTTGSINANFELVNSSNSVVGKTDAQGMVIINNSGEILLILSEPALYPNWFPAYFYFFYN